MKNFFGTDGIRGTVGKAPITADFILKVGWAVGSVLAEKGQIGFGIPISVIGFKLHRGEALFGVIDGTLYVIFRQHTIF